MDMIINVGAHGVRPQRESQDAIRAQALRPYGIPQPKIFNSTNP